MFFLIQVKTNRVLCCAIQIIIFDWYLSNAIHNIKKKPQSKSETILAKTKTTLHMYIPMTNMMGHVGKSSLRPVSATSMSGSGSTREKPLNGRLIWLPERLYRPLPGRGLVGLGDGGGWGGFPARAQGKLVNTSCSGIGLFTHITSRIIEQQTVITCPCKSLLWAFLSSIWENKLLERSGPIFTFA